MRVFNKSTGRLENLSRQQRSATGWNAFGGTQVNAPSTSMARLPGQATPAESMVSMHAAVVARQEKIRMVPLRLLGRDNMVVESGELFNLLQAPNRFQDWCGYVSLLEAYLSLYDFALVAMVGETDKPTELIPLNPVWCRPIEGIHEPTGMRIALGFEYTDPRTGASTQWTREQLIIIQGANPYAPGLRGLEAVRAAHRTVQLALATTEANLALFANGGHPDIVLESDQQWSKEQRDEFMEAWAARYSGFRNAHKVGILYGGLKVNTIGMNPEEMQAFESLRFARQDVCMALRVMPAMMMVMEGETGLSQGSSTEEQLVGWWGQVGIQELSRIGEAHERFLIKPFNWTRGLRTRSLERMESWSHRQMQRRRNSPQSASAYTIMFDLNVVPELVEHRRKRMKDFNDLRKEGYLPNDLNDYLELGLPEHPTNEGLIPFSLQPVDVFAGSAQAGSDSPAGEGTSQTDPEARSRATGAFDALDQLERALVSMASTNRGAGGAPGRASVTQREAEQPERSARDSSLRRQFDAVIAPLERQAAGRWARFFTEQRGRVLSLLDASGRTNRANQSRELSEDLLSEIFVRDQEDTALSARLSSIWTNSIQEGIRFFQEVDMEGVEDAASEFSIDDPRAASAVERRRIQGLKVNDTTEQDLRQLLRQSIDGGDTVQQLADNIREYYNLHGKADKARPQTAARTQVAGAVNDGRMAAALEVGGLLKYWLHGDPQEPRDAHVAAEIQYTSEPIPLEENFIINGVPMMSPGDAQAPIGETANCTCMLAFAPEEAA